MIHTPKARQGQKTVFSTSCTKQPWIVLQAHISRSPLRGFRLHSRKERIVAVPVQDEWIKMDDLFSFLRPLISYSTIEAMCGASFLREFPDFADSFWNFNSKMPILLQGWPRWMMPKTWQARDRCISTMKQWRKTCDKENFDGNAMILRRWSYFSKMQGLSEDGVACSDLGILWG